jgi:hypothetical protein
MKRQLLLSTCLPAFAALLLAGFVPVQNARAASATKNELITVLNPAVSTRVPDRVPLAPRLDTLDGKTIYLVDTDWEGLGQNTTVLEEMQQWFAKHMPGVKTIIKVKKGGYIQDDPALWKEIADNGGDGVIIGVAG